VIVGWTAPRRTPQYFGALVLALYDGKERLQFHRSVGTGFDQKTQRPLAQLEKLRVTRFTLRNPPSYAEHVEWVPGRHGRRNQICELDRRQSICEAPVSWAFVKIARRTTAVRRRPSNEPPSSRPAGSNPQTKNKRRPRHPHAGISAPESGFEELAHGNQKAFASW